MPMFSAYPLFEPRSNVVAKPRPAGNAPTSLLLLSRDMMTEPENPKTWSDWYRFARHALGYGHAESVEYANLRFVEEQNRAVLQHRK